MHRGTALPIAAMQCIFTAQSYRSSLPASVMSGSTGLIQFIMHNGLDKLYRNRAMAGRELLMLGSQVHSKRSGATISARGTADGSS